MEGVRRGPEPRTFQRPRGRARLTPDEMVGLRRGNCCGREGSLAMAEDDDEGERRGKGLAGKEIETGNGMVKKKINQTS